MAEIGMQMPGAQRRRSATLNVYAGLLLAAVTCLGAAVGVVYWQGAKIGPEGPLGPMQMHENPQRLQLAE